MLREEVIGTRGELWHAQLRSLPRSALRSEIATEQESKRERRVLRCGGEEKRESESDATAGTRARWPAVEPAAARLSPTWSTRVSVSERWCGRGDSNPHALASASPSSWCVCQFRHFRREGDDRPGMHQAILSSISPDPRADNRTGRAGSRRRSRSSFARTGTRGTRAGSADSRAVMPPGRQSTTRAREVRNDFMPRRDTPIPASAISSNDRLPGPEPARLCRR